MDEIIRYSDGFGNPSGFNEWFNKRKNHALSIEQYEHIVDYLVSNPKRITRASESQLHESAEKWTKTLRRKGHNIKESKNDTKPVLDFKDGFKIVQLIGKAAYEREGYLMRHCCASYYGRDVEVYSLRDSKNMPHCTIEKDKQIKGKGNGDIHPKYIDYVVRFLEHSGMNVRDSEMEHLGYIIPKFYAHTKNKKYRGKYVRKNEDIIYNDDTYIITSVNDAMNYKGDKFLLLDNNIAIQEKTEVEMDKLNKKSGSVYVRENTRFSAPQLREVSGSVYVRENARFSAPQLREVSGYVEVGKNAQFSAPQLQKSGYVDVRENAND